MGTAREHRQKRDLALSIAVAQILEDFNDQLDLTTILSIEFKRITSDDYSFVHPAWRDHPSRQRFNINLNWLRVRNKRRDKLDVSVWCGDTLCGLFLAKLSRRRVTVALRFLESNPFPNPLRGLMRPIGLIIAESYGAAYDVSEVLITQPERGLVEDYRKAGYVLNSADIDRERRKCKIRAKVLIKKLKD